LYCVAGRRDWEQMDQRKQLHRQAAVHYENALALRPGSAVAWAGLAIARQAMEDQPARVHAAWNEALRLGPHEGHVQPLLLQVVLSQWALASPPMQRWAEALFDGADAQKQAQINVLAKYYGLVFSPDTQAKTP
jgi:predicted TPR repeat methyltransferase